MQEDAWRHNIKYKDGSISSKQSRDIRRTSTSLQPGIIPTITKRRIANKILNIRQIEPIRIENKPEPNKSRTETAIFRIPVNKHKHRL